MCFASFHDARQCVLVNRVVLREEHGNLYQFINQAKGWPENFFKDAILRTCGIDLIKHRSSERSILKVSKIGITS